MGRSDTLGGPRTTGARRWPSWGSARACGTEEEGADPLWLEQWLQYRCWPGHQAVVRPSCLFHRGDAVQGPSDIFL